MMRLKAFLAIILAAAVSFACEAASAQGTKPGAGQDIIVAVDNPLDSYVRGNSGGLGGYAGRPRYVLGASAAKALRSLERDYALDRRDGAWPIRVLGIYCVVYSVPLADRDRMLKELAKDPRVRLVQPLQDFRLFGASRSDVAYDDPYLPLQRGFAETSAAQAHRVTNGHGVDIALVDTGVDTRHPDLAGRISSVRDFVEGDSGRADRHGTEIAGILAAVANNSQGIAGIAPGARISVMRACWYERNDQSARCNSFTLAKALAAVLDSDARIVNLSLGGPDDPLLAELLKRIVAQGRIVIAALPPKGRPEGFPSAQPGVILVGDGPARLPQGVLPAPGHDVLTLTPGGHYDFANGSSMAAAHVSGIAALLLSVRPDLDASQVAELLRASIPNSDSVVNAARAVDMTSTRGQPSVASNRP